MHRTIMCSCFRMYGEDRKLIRLDLELFYPLNIIVAVDNLKTANLLRFLFVSSFSFPGSVVLCF